MTEIALNKRQYLELEKIGLGALAPLEGFMTEPAFTSVVGRMRLPSGEVFPLPVTLDVDRVTADQIVPGRTIGLWYQGTRVGEVDAADVYTCDKVEVAAQVYGTSERTHAGVAHFNRMGSHFVGGRARLLDRVRLEFSDHELTPAQTRVAFAERGWSTIAGFQTRNVPHRAHEYLQRTALEVVDGLFIQPLVGYKKRGDYQPLAVLAGYRALLETCFPPERVLFGVLSTSMRYAGPREAVFHAIIRRNYGCTHFVVGRDHAGVGGYYGKYAAHQLTRRFDGELGIEVLRLSGPFYCRACGAIATEKTCRHLVEQPEVTHEISGSDMRRLLSGDGQPAPELMRPEVVSSLKGLRLFVEEDEA
ncbi:MAG: sulfate adenylyltransferase [Acidobacteria bacterium]|nr:sulfate adenylyltransferase [Acidobacteriota bacterium]